MWILDELKSLREKQEGIDSLQLEINRSVSKLQHTLRSGKDTTSNSVIDEFILQFGVQYPAALDLILALKKEIKEHIGKTILLERNYRWFVRRGEYGCNRQELDHRGEYFMVNSAIIAPGEPAGIEHYERPEALQHKRAGIHHGCYGGITFPVTEHKHSVSIEREINIESFTVEPSPVSSFSFGFDEIIPELRDGGRHVHDYGGRQAYAYCDKFLLTVGEAATSRLEKLLAGELRVLTVASTE